MSNLEECARAILANVPSGYGMGKAEAEEYAIAVLQALREPDEGMLAVRAHGNTAAAHWRAMIDHILADKAK